MAYILRRKQLIRKPLPEVFAFFADAANLEQITPSFLKFSITTPQPIVMRPGVEIDYRLSLFGIPFGWRTLIKEWQPTERFIDVQLRGPYKRWHHTHSFREVPEGTVVEDEVEYELPLGPLGRLAHWLFVRRTLETIFNYRQERIEKLL